METKCEQWFKYGDASYIYTRCSKMAVHLPVCTQLGHCLIKYLGRVMLHLEQTDGFGHRCSRLVIGLLYRRAGVMNPFLDSLPR